MAKCFLASRWIQASTTGQGTHVVDAVPAEFAATLERELMSAQAALAAKDREIENLVWNLAGCDTLAIGYAKPGEFSKELARPALHSVSKLRAERDALRAEVEHIKAWANAKADEAQDLRATLLAREGELDAMSAALAAKDREIKEERKRTATQEHVKNGVYMLADAWKARAEKAEAELASMRNRTPFLELSKCEQELFAAERDAAEAKRLLEADGKIRLHIVAERDQLHARVADLERQLAEAGKDKERIDWLENQGHLIARQYRDGWHFDASNGAWVCVNATTLRAAIDSAREAQP